MATQLLHPHRSGDVYRAASDRRTAAALATSSDRTQSTFSRLIVFATADASSLVARIVGENAATTRSQRARFSPQPGPCGVDADVFDCSHATMASITGRAIGDRSASFEIRQPDHCSSKASPPTFTSSSTGGSGLSGHCFHRSISAVTACVPSHLHRRAGPDTK